MGMRAIFDHNLAKYEYFYMKQTPDDLYYFYFFFLKSRPKQKTKKWHVKQIILFFGGFICSNVFFPKILDLKKKADRPPWNTCSLKFITPYMLIAKMSHLYPKNL